MKSLARLRRFLHCLTHLHQSGDEWSEAHFDTPNRFGLRSATLHMEMNCVTCGKVFWRAAEEKGPHE